MNLFQKLFCEYAGLRKENYVLFFGKIVTNMGSMVYPVLTLILSQKLGMNATDVATVIVISGVLVLPAGIIGGKLADNYNKKHIIIFCDLVSVVSFLICGVIPLSFKSILLLLAASGFQSAEHPCYSALIADITATKDRERAYSLMYLGANIGLVASPILAGFLFENYLWLSFIISGLSILSSTLLIAFMVKDLSKETESTSAYEYQKDLNGVSLFRILLDNKIILFFILINALYSSVYNQYSYLMPLDLGNVHGERGALIFGSLTSASCLEVVFFTPLLTRLFVKIKHTKKNLLGILLTLCAYSSFLLFLGHVPCYYIAMTFFTLGEVFTTLSNGPYLSARIPASHRGRINGFQTFLQNFFYGILMLILGMLYDKFGNTATWILVLSLLVAAAAGAILLIPLDRKAYRQLYKKQKNSVQ